MLPLVPKVLYFAQLVDVPSVSSEALRLDVELSSVAELSAKLAQRGGAWERVFGLRAVCGLRSTNRSLSSIPWFDGPIRLGSFQADNWHDAPLKF